jgi:GH15 family glucan-1,4-alpha-glucosidase
VAEGLGEVAQQLAAVRVDLLGQEADVVGVAGELVEERLRAVELFERLTGLVNDVGLLSEEYDPGAGRLVGNFPQAFSHIALVDSALLLTREASRAPAGERAEV